MAPNFFRVTEVNNDSLMKRIDTMAVMVVYITILVNNFLQEIFLPSGMPDAISNRFNKEIRDEKSLGIKSSNQQL